MANTSTKKSYGGVKAPVAGNVGPSRTAVVPNQPGARAGQMSGKGQPFGEPMNDGAPAAIKGLSGTHNDIGEMSGFITDGYLDKQRTPYGEAAKFNFLPPGMEIDNQENAEINMMPLRILVAESYPGDGWSPAPRDVPE